MADEVEREKLARIAALVQHRCHPRAADVVHTLVNVKLGAFPGRVALLGACLASRPGEEPADAFLVDPAAQGIRLRSQRRVPPPAAAGQGAGAAAAAPGAPAAAAAAAAGGAAAAAPK
jgi:hypothetical protein